MLSAHLGRAVRTTVPMPVHQIAHSSLVRSSYKKRAFQAVLPQQKPLEVMGDVLTVVLEEDGPALLSCEEFHE